MKSQQNNLCVREADQKDFESIVDYFLKADDAFLISLGVDISKLPTRENWLTILNDDFALPLKEKQFYYIIWLLDSQPVGHSNINKIIFGKEAYMHLHLWDITTRKKRLGPMFLKLTLPFYFEVFELETLYCEPSAANPAPNKVLSALGFEFVKSYETIPGWINSLQNVNRWKIFPDK